MCGRAGKHRKQQANTGRRCVLHCAHRRGSGRLHSCGGRGGEHHRITTTGLTFRWAREHQRYDQCRSNVDPECCRSIQRPPLQATFRRALARKPDSASTPSRYLPSLRGALAGANLIRHFFFALFSPVLIATLKRDLHHGPTGPAFPLWWPFWAGWTPRPRRHCCP